MRKIILIAAMAVLAPTAANAQTWIAACNDGMDLQYTQTVGGKGILHMSKGDGTYQGIALVQNSYNGTIICSVGDDRTPQNGEHALKVCADRSSGFITLKYKDTTGTGQSISDAQPYCRAIVSLH